MEPNTAILPINEVEDEHKNLETIESQKSNKNVKGIMASSKSAAIKLEESKSSSPTEHNHPMKNEQIGNELKNTGNLNRKENSLHPQTQ